MDDAAIKKAIELFGNARLKHTFLGGDVPPELHPQTVAEGYAIQEGVVDYLLANGFGSRDEIGIKIGLTSKENREIWGGEAHLGANHPTMNFIWKMYHEHADLKWEDYHQLFVECEFGVRMGRDCPASDAPYTQESIAEYVDVCMAGIELVDPCVDYRQTPAPMIPLALADNAANSGGVFGKGTTEWRDLDIPNIKGTMVIDGEEMETGPVFAARWPSLQHAVVGCQPFGRAGQPDPRGPVPHSRLGDRDLSFAARLNGRHDFRTSWSGELLDHLSRQEPRRKGGR